MLWYLSLHISMDMAKQFQMNASKIWKFPYVGTNRMSHYMHSHWSKVGKNNYECKVLRSHYCWHLIFQHTSLKSVNEGETVMNQHQLNDFYLKNRLFNKCHLLNSLLLDWWSRNTENNPNCQSRLQLKYVYSTIYKMTVLNIQK